MATISQSSVIPQVPSSPNQEENKGVFSRLKADYNTFWNQKPIEIKPNPAAVPKAPVIKNEGSYKSLADLQATGYSKDARLAKFAAARQLKDPSQAPTPELKMQAVSGKLSRLYNDPKFQALPDNYKIQVAGHYYDKYVAPALKANGIEPPDREHWLAGYGSEKTYKASEDLEENKPLESKVLEGAATMLHKNADLTNLVANTLNYTIGAKAPFRDQEEKADYAKYGKRIDKTIATIHNFADSVNQVATGYESAFQPRSGAYHWASNFAANFIGDAPAYVIVGGIAGKAAEGIIPSMAEKGAISKGYAVALSVLKNAGEVFSVREGEGAGLRQSTEDAAGALVLSLGIHGAIAKFGGAKLGAGGEPLANKISEDADTLDRKEGIQDPELEKDTVTRMKALVNPNDPDYKQVVQNERFLREHFARELHPDKAESAGGKSVWRNLSKAQRENVKAQVSEITKQSGELQPLINPELQMQANSVALAREAKENPEHAAFQLQLEKETGLKVSEILTKVQAKEVGTKTGLTSTSRELEQAFHNPEALPRDLSKSAPRYGAYKIDFQDPKDLALYTVGQANKNKAHDRFMAYLLKQFPGKSEAELRSMGREVKGRIQREIPNTEGDTISLPRVNEQESFGHQDMFSEGRVAGARTVSTKGLLNPNLPTEDFVRGTTRYLEKNKATQSGHDYFENPEHHLLWVANHSDAPDNIKSAAFNRLRRDFNISHAQAITKGQWLAEHVSDLRDTGILADKGNVYRSTKVTQRRYGTQWQHQLYEDDLLESDMHDLKAITRAKPELKAPIEGLLETLNYVRNKAATPLNSRLRRNAQKELIDTLKRYK